MTSAITSSASAIESGPARSMRAGQRLFFDELEVRLPVRHRRIEDVDHVGVADATASERLLEKARARTGIARHFRAEHPEGAAILPKYARGIGIPLTFVIGAEGKVGFTQRNRAGDEHALERAILDAIDDASARCRRVWRLTGNVSSRA